MRRLLPLVLALSLASTANAAEPTERPSGDVDVKDAVPNVAYTFSTGRGSIGAQAYGLGLAATGQRAVLGGGASAWGSIDRLTLLGDASRDATGRFTPSAGALVRITDQLAVLGRYKVQGFGVGPNGELESEVEAGLVLSLATSGFHLDANAIAGAGLDDVDAEGRLRVLRDVTGLLRVGLDGQARARVAGSRPLAGGRTWDFAGGPQLVLGSGALFGALTAGPATQGVDREIGWMAVLTLGGVRL